MFDKLEAMAARYQELNEFLSEPAASQSANYTSLLKEHGSLGKIVPRFLELQTIQQEIGEAREMVEAESDAEMVALARSEIESLVEREKVLVDDLQDELAGRDELSNKDVIVEIRAGVGGDEAALFARDLLKMYSKFAEQQSWKVELMDSHQTEMGGFKGVVFSIQGQDVYRFLRYESGVHRVQRVPETESAGRIHTSTATVAVLPEAEEVEVDIKQDDLRIDRFAASGPGGQHVNKTESAIRLTHLPTGIVVSCQDEKSQHKNLSKAMRVLRSRVLEAAREEQETERAEERRSQIGTGDRSQKIRTYNFPESRVTDHRINFKSSRLFEILEGGLGELIESLQDHHKQQRLDEL